MAEVGGAPMEEQPSDGTASSYPVQAAELRSEFPSKFERAATESLARVDGGSGESNQSAGHTEEQNERRAEFPVGAENFRKDRSYQNSNGGLSKVSEEGESFRSVKAAKQTTAPHMKAKRRGKKKKIPILARVLGCILYPLKKLRDGYIRCCFQIAGAGDLTGLVGGGHVVGPLEVFPLPREDSDKEDD